MSKKVSSGIIVLGVIMLVAGGVITFVTKDANNESVATGNPSYVDTSVDESTVSDDNCNVMYNNNNYVDSELSSSCSAYNLRVERLTFNFVKGADGMFNLEIKYDNNVIYSSTANSNVIYSDAQAGSTKIKKIDDLYFVETSAAAQCGNVGTLIVVTSSGTLKGIYNVIDVEFNKDAKEVSYYTDPNNTCANVTDAQLVEVTYTINGTELVEKK